jgi:adenosylmethionine-8-amino-7-oxononanoate aminotransferase
MFCEEVAMNFSRFKPRNLGTIFALTLNPEDGLDYTHNLRAKIYNYFLEKDLLVRPIGNVLYTVPPYCIEKDDLSRLHQSILGFLESL